MHEYKKIISEEDYNAEKEHKKWNQGETTKEVSKNIVQTI